MIKKTTKNTRAIFLKVMQHKSDTKIMVLIYLIITVFKPVRKVLENCTDVKNIKKEYNQIHAFIKQFFNEHLEKSSKPVSYTHLTLPTILLV